MIINEGKIHIKAWTDDLIQPEYAGALSQAINLSNLPFAFHHVAIMPDTHQGFGMCIGGVLATKDVIIPNAVGVDIGCGMCAVKTSLTDIDKDTLKKIMGEIRKTIPVGAEHNKKVCDFELMPDLKEHNITEDTIVWKEFENARTQLGTLGGGNHFEEIQKGSDGHIWIMIHSGSRNLGKKVADYYNDLATKLNEKWHSSVPSKWELAYLPLESDEGKRYLQEMQYCVDFALANRKLMMERIKDIFVSFFPKKAIGYETETKGKTIDDGSYPSIYFDPIINIAHNYASLENHFGENVWVHRKGATLARKDTIGIIPGSQGTKSYIVRGKGNPDSFMSCSHGSGRMMSRSKAKELLDLETEKKLLDDQGIIHGIRTVKDLDEAAGAYKNISTVMSNQSDLVEILVELSPLAVIKS